MPEPDPGERLLCPIANVCGGCSLIGTAYSEQLAVKTARVRAALAVHAELDATVVEPCRSAPHAGGYRNRAKLAVAGLGDELRIGLYERASNRIVDLAPCRVQRPRISAAVEAVRAWLARNDLAAPVGPVIYIDIREVCGEAVHLTIVVDAATHGGVCLPHEQLESSPVPIAGIAINLGDARSSYPIGQTTRPVRGPASFLAPLPVDDGEFVEIEVPATGFFQVSTDALPFVHATMRQFLGEDGDLYDLYCGVGVHGLTISRGRQRDGATLIGVESNRAAVGAAVRNAERFGVRAEFVAASVEDCLPRLLKERPAARIVLNPGRSGCHRRVVEALGTARPRRLAYLSCNPDTLARDLAACVRTGLRVARVLPFDLMPQTDQVEVLALLDRA